MIHDIQSLEDIKKLRENIEIECKLAQGRDGKGALPKDMWETYSAFANTQGGDIFLGIKEQSRHHFELAGIENTQVVLDELWRLLNDPHKVSYNVLSPQWVHVRKLEHKKFIHIHVPKAEIQNMPVYIDGDSLRGSY